MRKLFIVLAVFTAVLTSCTGIRQEVNDTQPSSFQPKPLDDEWSRWLIGTWQVTEGQSDFLGDASQDLIESNDQGAGGFTIESGLNGQFLIWKSWAPTSELTDEQKKLMKEALKETTHASDEDLERFVSMPFQELQISEPVALIVKSV